MQVSCAETIKLPGLNNITMDNGLIEMAQSSDGQYSIGKDGVQFIFSTGDKKVEFISFESHTIAYVASAMGYPALYPVHPVHLQKPVKAVLMDLDGTSVHSEEFWIWIIEQTTASLLNNKSFQLENADLPFVSGHSVSEHLQHCIQKYCPDKTVEEARAFYFEHTKREMTLIMEGKGKADAFKPSPDLKPFLLELKKRNIKIGLVTSGLYEKAYPEIYSAFTALQMGKPEEFYDAIITAGFPLGKGRIGTLGELSPKPHPWLYAETCRVGLGIEFADRNSVIGIEDSGAGVCSIRIAGYPTIGIGGGNIIDSGTKNLCTHYCETLSDVLPVI